MRIFLLFLILFSSLSANINFWSELNEGINILFNQNYNENNVSKDNDLLKSDKELQSTVQKRENFYLNIIKTIKKESFKIEDTSIDFYNKEALDDKAQELEDEKKIEAKKRRIKFTKDKEVIFITSLKEVNINIELLNIELKKQIFTFLHNLTYDYQILQISNLKKRIDRQLTFIQYFKQDLKMYKNDMEFYIDKNSKKYQELLSEIDKNISKVEILLNMYDDFITYLDKNRDTIFVEKSVVKKLALNKTIDVVNKASNKISYIAVINKYLKKINIDIGRLVIFFLVIGFFWTLRVVTNRYFIPFLKRKLDTPEVDSYDIVLYNFDDIKRPLTYIVRTFGLDLAIDVLVYPREAPDFINTILSLAYTIFIAWFIIVIIDLAVAIYLEKRYQKSKKEVRKELVNLSIKVAKVIVLLISSIIFLKNAGFNITALLTSLGIGGLAVALAAKDTIANFFSSLKIILEESFSQGDWIKSGDVEGTVVEIGFGSTKIRTFDNALISVPNSILANQSIKNWSRRVVGRRIKMHIGVTYDSNREDLKKAVQEIKRMLEEHPGIANDRKIKYDKRKQSKLIKIEDKYGIKNTLLVYFDQFSASSIDILIYAFSNSVNWAEWLKVKEDVLYKIWEIIERNNLEFAFPTQTIFYQNLNDLSNIPLEKLKKNSGEEPRA